MHKIALFPGTFDPVTNGHLALIKTAAALFDEVVVCLLINPDKTCLFSEETRRTALAIAVRELPNVRVNVSHGMTADLSATLHATIVRGIRSVSDAAYELEMARFNEERNGTKTIFIPAEPSLSAVSSTAVRESIRKGTVPDAELPLGVGEYLRSVLCGEGKA